MSERDEIEIKIQEAYDEIHKNPSQLPERLWASLEGISSMILAWKHAKGANGWSQALMGKDGKPIFTPDQSRNLEAGIKHIQPQMENMFGNGNEEEQTGGAAELSNLKSGFGEHVKVPIHINPEDVSIDKVYHNIFDTLDQYDEQWKEIAASLGVVQGVETAMEREGVIPTPVGPIPYYIPGKAVLPFLNVFLDIIRVAYGNPMRDIPTVRILLSVVIGFLELIRGDWQTAVMTLVGVISPKILVIGVFGKILRNAWLFIAPDLQRQLRDNIFRSSKSMVVGFLLWLFSIFSPKFIKIAVNNSFDKMKELVENFNEKAQQLEEKAQATAATAGIVVSFPKIPMKLVPNMDDIQNLQTLAKIPAIYCSPEFQKILEPILIVPPLRLVVELLNIPTLPDDRKEQCAGTDTSGLAKSVSNLATPEISVIPGGPADMAGTAAAATAAIEEKTNAATSSVKNKIAAIEEKKEFKPMPVRKPRKTRKTTGGSRNKNKKRRSRRRTRNRLSK